MPQPADTPRDLLFALLALQNGLIDQSALVSAFHAWSLARDRPMAEILVEQGSLDADQRALLEGLASLHLKKHGGDAEKSLAAFDAGPSTAESLRRIGDPELTATLARVSRSTRPAGQEAGDPSDATRTMTIGTATSAGQRFRVLRPHAQGGLGAVFVALDGELNREVALKQILDHHADDPQSRTRFQLEAEITGGLEHPGIVPVYGLGHYGDGRPYYAMRFIRGESLKEAIAAFHADRTLEGDPGARGLALRKLLRRFVDVCNAIDYAHGRGVLHRDLKPGNVIVGKHGETLVVDWGLAKTMGHSEVGRGSDERTLMPSSSSGSADTLPGSALGTPAYMSPEQAAGDLKALGPRSDVYSLGATLYCLLVGRPPFEGPDLGAVLRAVAKGDFPKPTAVDPSVPRPLEAICLKAMAVKPDDRYASTRALAEEIERWMADEPVSAWREPWRVRARRWASRRRTLVTIAGAATCLAAVVSTGAAWFMARSLDRETRALAEMTIAKQKETEALNDARSATRNEYNVVDTFLTRAGNDLQYVPGAQVVRRNLLEAAARSFDQRAAYSSKAGLGDGREAYYRVAQIRRELGQDDEALQALKKARESFEKAARAGHTPSWQMVGNTYLESGLIHWGRSRMTEALADFRAAAEANTKAIEIVDGFARSQDALWTDGVGYLARAKNDLGSSFNNLGLVLKDLGRNAEARQAYDKSTRLRRENVARHPTFTMFVTNLGSNLLNLGILESQFGHANAAIEDLREAARLRDEALALDPDKVNLITEAAYTHAELAATLARFGLEAEADREFDRAIKAFQVLADGNPTVVRIRYWQALCWLHHASLLARTGRDGQVAGELTRAIETSDELQKGQPASTDYRNIVARACPLLAGACSRLKRPDEALKAARRGVSEAESLARIAPDIPANFENLARARLALGEVLAPEADTREEALRSLRQAVADATRAETLAPDVPWNTEALARTRAAIARVLKAQGKISEAREAADAARRAIARVSQAMPGIPYLERDLAEIDRQHQELEEASTAGPGRPSN